MVYFLGRNKIPTPWVVYVLGRNKIPTPWVVNLTKFFSLFWRFFWCFHGFSLFFDYKGLQIWKNREIIYVYAIKMSFVLLDVLLLKIVRIGLLTNRLGRNKIPYHLGNNSSPCGFAARGRIISLVVRNFIPTRAIGQESYISKRDVQKLGLLFKQRIIT